MKKAISVLLALALCLGLCIPVSAAGTFTDVEGNWAAPYIERAASLGLVRGVGEGRYAPEKAVSYCEHAVMLCGIRYQDEAALAAAGNTGAWWLPYCVVADNHGLWDSTVMADRQAWNSQSGQPVPRQSMAQMMYNYLQAEKKQLPSEVDKEWKSPIWTP